MTITIGSILKDNKNNNYKIVEHINSGGFGQIFLCERMEDKKKYVIKTMLNTFPSNEEYEVFRNELQAAIEIKGENVINYEFVHDGSLFDNVPPYIIMEYADKGDLSNILDERKKEKSFFTNEEIVNVFLQLARGMNCINKVLVHRDIKPQNILFDGKQLKIADFGLAKYTDAATRTITFKGYGTQAYCAPEVWRNEKNTIQMDIYSMGIVFYEIATLNYPYNIKNNNYEEAHLYHAIDNPADYNPSLSPSIVSLINKMLQKSIGKRFKNWQEIIEILENDKDNKLVDNEIGELILEAVKLQNNVDNYIERKKSEELKKDREWNNHVKNINSHFYSEVFIPIKRYIDVFNSKYASEKITIETKDTDLSSPRKKTIIRLPRGKRITITTSIIDSEKPIKKSVIVVSGVSKTRNRDYPVCNGKKVLAWGKVENNYQRGYNLLLLENGIDEYGDWYILYNTNSGLSRNNRPEPFAFSESELPREITLINSTHIYSSILEKYNINRFHELILMCENGFG